MAESATFALKAGVWFRRGRLLIVSPDSRGTACPLSGRNSTYRPVQISAAGSIRCALEAIDNEAIDRLCLIGLVHRGTVGTDVEVDYFAMGIQPIEQAGLGKVFAAGTGRAAFL